MKTLKLKIYSYLVKLGYWIKQSVIDKLGNLLFLKLCYSGFSRRLSSSSAFRLYAVLCDDSTPGSSNLIGLTGIQSQCETQNSRRDIEGTCPSLTNGSHEQQMNDKIISN